MKLFNTVCLSVCLSVCVRLFSCSQKPPPSSLSPPASPPGHQRRSFFIRTMQAQFLKHDKEDHPVFKAQTLSSIASVFYSLIWVLQNDQPAKKTKPIIVLPHNLPLLVFESSNTFESDLYLTAANWSATLFFNDIKDHSTSSRNRNMWHSVTSNHDNQDQRGPRLRLVFYSLIWALQNDWLFLRASALTLLNFHCLRVTISCQISWRILL